MTDDALDEKPGRRLRSAAGGDNFIFVGDERMTTQDFAPMGVGQILDRTFRLYKRNFARFVAIVAVVKVPITLLMLVVFGLMGYQAASGQTGTQEMSGAQVATLAVGTLVTVFLTMLAQTLSQGALTKSVSESYLGKEVTVGQAYGFVWPRVWRLLGAALLVSLVVMGGVMLCVVPGIIFGLWFVLTSQMIVVENQKITGAMTRSKRLVSGNLGKVFVLGFLVWLIGMIIGMIFGYGGAFLARVLAGGSQVGATIISQILSLVGQILVAPIGAAAFVLLYYDLRIRKEAFDLEMLAASMGSGETPPEADAPTP